MPGDTSSFWEDVQIVADIRHEDVGVVAKQWAQTQVQDFYHQMLGGIRYFDLRAGWQNTTNIWVTFHYVDGSPVEYLLGNISAYLRDYPKEIVIVEISHFDGYPNSSDIIALKTMVQNILGPYLAPVDLTFSFTVNQMISTGKRAMVTMAKAYDNVTIWPPSSIYNTYADSPNLKQMIEFNNKTVNTFMQGTWPNELFKISWTLTANSDTITSSVLPWNPHTLLMLADNANKALPSFDTEMKNYGWRMGNILIIDDYANSIILKVVCGFNNIPF
jgi:hypothetical protein